MAKEMSAINIQIDSETKNEATTILNNLGLSMSTAINIFLKQVIKNDGLPFEVKNPKPNRRLRKAIKEAERIANDPNHKGYRNIEELFKSLEE